MLMIEKKLNKARQNGPSQFKRDLDYSVIPHAEAKQLYRQLFGERLISVSGPIEHKVDQGLGCDRIVNVSPVLTYRIDEKRRRSEHEDILLEVWSNREKQKPGWIQKTLGIDFVLYLFDQSGRAYLLPWTALQQAYWKHGDRWTEQYGIVQGTTKVRKTEYHSENVAVPIGELYECMADVSEARIVRPRAVKHG